MTQTLTLEQFKQQPLEEILNEVVTQEVTLIVRMPEGQEILIEPRLRLRPLPVLDGYVPEGWKDAVYR